MTDLLFAATEMVSLLAEAAGDAPFVPGVSGSLTLGLAGAGAGIGVGLVGMGAAQAVGRNPGAFGKILTIGIIGMALAEAIAIYALIMAFGKY
ncbi:MAG: F-type H+-transporting ATPase subunit c [Verrucomicrobiales bacterium]|jgi:F-type H+-transporting ATPase subunit c